MSDQGRLTIDIKAAPPLPDVDWYRVLLEYMRAVKRAEGITFVDHIDDFTLTAAEMAVLVGMDMALDLEDDPPAADLDFGGEDGC
jgi:catalase (peroxidase I)